MNYLVEQLTNNGLFSYITENGLFICWDQSMIDLVKYKNTQKNMNPNQGENVNPQSMQKIESINQSSLNNKSKPKQINNPTRPRKQQETRVINVVKIENDDIPINLDAFNKRF